MAWLILEAEYSAPVIDFDYAVVAWVGNLLEGYGGEAPVFLVG